MPRRQPSATQAIQAIQPPQLPRQLGAPPCDELADGGGFSACALADCDFAGQTADDLLFDRMVGRRVNLNQARLTLAQLLDVRFDTCDLAGSEWEKPHLRRVELLGCRLVGLKLLDADVEDALFQKCNAELARIWSSQLRATRFEQCVLREASFEGSDLSGAVFHGCDLSKADLRGTKLCGADLRGSTLTGVQIGIKELQGAIIDPGQAIMLAGLLGIVVKVEDEVFSKAQSD